MEINNMEPGEDETNHMVRLKGKTIKRLQKIGMMHESFDSLINRIITGFERKVR